MRFLAKENSSHLAMPHCQYTVLTTPKRPWASMIGYEQNGARKSIAATGNFT